MFKTPTTKELVGTFILFIVIYFTLYLDNKINIKYDDNGKQIIKPSIKLPMIMSIMLLIIYKSMEDKINSYLIPNMQIKQNIITDMVDF